MYRFFERLSRFMYGRYGLDALGKFLMVVYLLDAISKIFLHGTAKTIVFAVQLAIFIVFILRILSRNIIARQRENNFYLRTIGRAEPKFKLLFKRIRDIGKKRYRTCPNCKTVARLPIRRGRHTVKCPVCRQEYKVYILL